METEVTIGLVQIGHVITKLVTALNADVGLLLKWHLLSPQGHPQASHKLLKGHVNPLGHWCGNHELNDLQSLKNGD